MLTILIDADVLAYRYGYAGTDTFTFGETTCVSVDPDAAFDMANEHIEDVANELGADHIVLCFSDPNDSANWRLDVLPTYKHNRDISTRPELYYSLREQLEERYMSVWRPTLEADDILGILMTMPRVFSLRRGRRAAWVPLGGERVCVSIDKDLLQIPGMHYNPNTRVRKQVDKIDGDYFHMLQTLAGDSVDGYDGITGIGMKRAEKILEPAEGDLGCMWELVVRAYIESGQFPVDPEGAALVTARVAKILQVEDYDNKEERPCLWTPPE